MVAKEKVFVREATSRDADGLIKVLSATRLDGEAWEDKEAFVAGNLQTALQNGGLIVLVAECNSSIVGFVDCAVFPSFWECQKQGLIADFFVHPSYQGNGVGSRLLQALIKKADEQHLVELHVSTEPANVKARRLYTKFGFSEERLILERSEETT
jgi:ribosomal-protein-alanine N-acetyltransferase